MSSATTLREAQFLAAHGVDAIIAQGSEAGGHRGMFLETDVATQVGTLALVRAIAAAVQVPVIAAGGIADGRGIAAALALGASAVQIGTAYLVCHESTTSALHKAALAEPGPRDRHHQRPHRGRGARHRQPLHPRTGTAEQGRAELIRSHASPSRRCGRRPRRWGASISRRYGRDRPRTCQGRSARANSRSSLPRTRARRCGRWLSSVRAAQPRPWEISRRRSPARRNWSRAGGRDCPPSTP